MTLGAVMLDIQGTHIHEDELALLREPVVGGVILFTRNYEDKEQLQRLVFELKALDRASPLLIAVDHEGGRVQRFREGFTHIVPMGKIGAVYQQHPDVGLTLAHDAGFIMADELLQVGIDFSFAPVLDLDYGTSLLVGDRSFSGDPAVVALLARAFISGMREAGMCNVGKHFPGHGFVTGDSHHELPIDNRDFVTMSETCLQPFKALIQEDLLDAIMPAHIIYPAVDDMPAGFSSIWLKRFLRQELGFQGVIFSDDLCMAGAEFAGSYSRRADVALDAGCDMVLVCNQPAAARAVVEHLRQDLRALGNAKLSKLYGTLNNKVTDAMRQLYRQRYLSAIS